ncbi:MAG: Pr6Pr family membrane protein [Candidatus Izemoplasmatales bacterium]|nr:Pr6Pr family membrane protein [Candidatus Izemoplasmatales bacterium]
MLNKTKGRKLYIIILLIGNLIGIILSLVESDSLIQSISYFTWQSNVFVLLFFSYLLFKNKELSIKEQSVKAAVTIAILLTFIVYHTLLDPFFNPSEYTPPFWRNFLVHTYTPLLVLLDYFLFDKKGKLQYRMVPHWLTMPFAYFIYANIYAILGGTFVFEDSVSRYPYFFMNPDKIGWGFVIIFVLVISLFISTLSILFVFLDKKIVEEKKYHDREVS